jgi:hypothetical protein
MMRFGLSIVVAVLVGTAAYAADLPVIDSDTTTYAKGDVIDSEQVVRLGTGEKLVLQMPNGRTVTLRGPWDGKPVDEETAFDTSSATKYLRTPPQPPRHTGLTFRSAKKAARVETDQSDEPACSN